MAVAQGFFGKTLAGGGCRERGGRGLANEDVAVLEQWLNGCAKAGVAGRAEELECGNAHLPRCVGQRSPHVRHGARVSSASQRESGGRSNPPHRMLERADQARQGPWVAAESRTGTLQRPCGMRADPPVRIGECIDDRLDQAPVAAGDERSGGALLDEVVRSLGRSSERLPERAGQRGIRTGHV